MTETRYVADIPPIGAEHGEPCEGACGARTFPARTLEREPRQVLIEAIPGRPMAFGEEHSPERCAQLRGVPGLTSFLDRLHSGPTA